VKTSRYDGHPTDLACDRHRGQAEGPPDRRATDWIRSASATEVPPNFITIVSGPSIALRARGPDGAPPARRPAGRPQRFSLTVRVLVTFLPLLAMNTPVTVSFKCYERFNSVRPARESLILSLALPALANVFEPEATTTERVAGMPDAEDQVIVSVPGVSADTLAW
jgi:hypothetical protein